MPMMKSPYDQVLATLAGHRIVATADEPIWIPDNCVSQARGQGFMEVDAPVPDANAAQTGNEDNDDDGDEEAEFQTGLDQALLKILTRGDDADFKNDGSPKVNNVVAEMSPDLRRPTATEISEAYQRLQENIDLAE